MLLQSSCETRRTSTETVEFVVLSQVVKKKEFTSWMTIGCTIGPATKRMFYFVCVFVCARCYYLFIFQLMSSLSRDSPRSFSQQSWGLLRESRTDCAPVPAKFYPSCSTVLCFYINPQKTQKGYWRKAKTGLSEYLCLNWTSCASLNWTGHTSNFDPYIIGVDTFGLVDHHLYRPLPFVSRKDYELNKSTGFYRCFQDEQPSVLLDFFIVCFSFGYSQDHNVKYTFHQSIWQHATAGISLKKIRKTWKNRTFWCLFKVGRVEMPRFHHRSPLTRAVKSLLHKLWWCSSAKDGCQFEADHFMGNIRGERPAHAARKSHIRPRRDS